MVSNGYKPTGPVLKEFDADNRFDRMGDKDKLFNTEEAMAWVEQKLDKVLKNGDIELYRMDVYDGDKLLDYQYNQYDDEEEMMRELEEE